VRCPGLAWNWMSRAEISRLVRDFLQRKRNFFNAKAFAISDKQRTEKKFPFSPPLPHSFYNQQDIASVLSIVASIPYRFKAGGDGNMPSTVQHSHRSTTKASHKPFKSKKASKGALKEISKGLRCINSSRIQI
jgi:hypothetical protein